VWPSRFVGGQSLRRALQVKPGVRHTLVCVIAFEVLGPRTKETWLRSRRNKRYISAARVARLSAGALGTAPAAPGGWARTCIECAGSPCQLGAAVCSGLNQRSWSVSRLTKGFLCASAWHPVQLSHAAMESQSERPPKQQGVEQSDEPDKVRVGNGWLRPLPVIRVFDGSKRCAEVVT